MSEAPPPAVHALRYFATTYSGARRAVSELRTKLAALEHERKTWIDAAESGNLIGPPERELAEIERVHRTVARSAAVSTDRLRALEAVIAAIARDVLAVAAEAVQTRSQLGDAFGVRPAPDASIRGGWSPPGGP